MCGIKPGRKRRRYASGMSIRSHNPITPEMAASIAAAEHDDRRRQKRLALIFSVIVAIGMGLVVYVMYEMARNEPPKVVIDPAKLPPIVPGPRR